MLHTRRRHTAIALLVVALAAVGVAALLLLRGDGSDAAARQALDRFAATWSSGGDAAAGRLTDAPGTAARTLAANRSGLDGARVAVHPGPLHRDGDAATATLDVRWQVPAIGAFATRTPVTLRHVADDRWVVHFTPRVVDPRLTAATRLGTEARAPERAPILDRDGHELVGDRPVVRVGLARNGVRDVRASATALARLVDVDARTLERALRGAGPQQFVEAIALRPVDYAPIADRLRAIPGGEAVDARLPLAPSREFARALLGGVAPATAEQIQRSGGRLAPGDAFGQWGLEQRYDAQLAGVASRRIVIRDSATGDVRRTLRRVAGRAPRPVRTRLSASVQDAAERALGDTRKPSALVAVQPSTGDVLAVANRPTDSTFDRALAGTYAPGSTFKIVTTAALLRAGLSTGAPVPCPPTITVDGKAFRNFEGEASATPSFADDFAISCNTAFISLADRLGPDALPTAAADFGLGRRLRLGVGVAQSRVPSPRDAVAHAAAMIGQDRISTSPLAMAGVAATVAEGRWRAPRLLASDPRTAGPALPGGEAQTLHELMRGVVTHGTGTALATIPGGVAGKTGTAEYGSGDPPPTHAWFVAFRGDLAVSVLVEDGPSGSETAAPIAARFFSAL